MSEHFVKVFVVQQRAVGTKKSRFQFCSILFKINFDNFANDHCVYIYKLLQRFLSFEVINITYQEAIVLIEIVEYMWACNSIPYISTLLR